MSFYDLDATFRPIDKWPGEETSERQYSRFKATWSDTVELLGRELRALDAADILCLMALRERDIRLDGYPRANAKPGHPGIVLAFDSRYGPLKYACDTFTDWQDNVRAIALGLEALRKVDRYGITKRGEQYTGWKALPGGPAVSSTMNISDAATFVSMHSSVDGRRLNPSAVLNKRSAYALAKRQAIRALHPDAGGNAEDYQVLTDAIRALDAHHRSS